MKKFYLLLFLVLGISFSIQAQSSIERTLTISCATITTSDASESVKKYLLDNFPDKILHYQADLDQHTATITCTIEAVDVLQLYQQLGYEALFLSDSKKYSLTPDGSRIRIVKE
jgi:hypothetical protein